MSGFSQNFIYYPNVFRMGVQEQPQLMGRLRGLAALVLVTRLEEKRLPPSFWEERTQLTKMHRLPSWKKAEFKNHSWSFSSP